MREILHETTVIAYHGTGNRFDAFHDGFRPNFFTTDMEYAKGYVGGKTHTNLIDRPKKTKNYLLKCEVTYNHPFDPKTDPAALEYYNTQFIPYMNALHAKHKQPLLPELEPGKMVSFIYADYLWGFMKHEETPYDAILVDEGGSIAHAIVPMNASQVKILKRQIIKFD